MNAAKADFLRNSLVPLLKEIPSDTQPLWGKMTLQQMIEHFSDAVRIASGKLVVTSLFTPEDALLKMQAFLMSDKPFRENTVNPMMPEVPAPVRNSSIKAALEELQSEVRYFFDVFRANEHLTTTNPFFGELNYDMNVQALYKHAAHHLRQFGVNINS